MTSSDRPNFYSSLFFESSAPFHSAMDEAVHNQLQILTQSEHQIVQEDDLENNRWIRSTYWIKNNMWQM